MANRWGFLVGACNQPSDELIWLSAQQLVAIIIRLRTERQGKSQKTNGNAKRGSAVGVAICAELLRKKVERNELRSAIKIELDRVLNAVVMLRCGVLG